MGSLAQRRPVSSLLLRFTGSSVASAVIDVVLFAAALRSGLALAESVFVARALSSVFNFAVNRHYVFASGRSIVVSVILYYALVALLGVSSWAGARTLHEGLGLSVLMAKILTDLLLFGLSFLAQRTVVFRWTSGRARR